MKKIGLTGGIGSGKSYVAEIFRHLGVPVFNSDDVARDIQNRDTEVKQAIAETFEGVYSAEGNLDRRKLASIVFTDQAKLKTLNSIVHPAVGKAFEEFCELHARRNYVIKEAAIIFELGLDEQLDGTILVTAPENVRIARVMERDNSTEMDVRARMQKQWSDQQKSERADWTIINDGDRALLPQILRIHSAINHL
jgi:dephospho-CoA kinase